MVAGDDGTMLTMRKPSVLLYDHGTCELNPHAESVCVARTGSYATPAPSCTRSSGSSGNRTSSVHSPIPPVASSRPHGVNVSGYEPSGMRCSLRLPLGSVQPPLVCPTPGGPGIGGSSDMCGYDHHPGAPGPYRSGS